MRFFLSKYLLLPILVIIFFNNSLNAITFEINESNGKKIANLPFKIRIYSPENYKLTLAKFLMMPGDTSTVKLSALLLNDSATMKSLKSVIISCAPRFKGTEYSEYGSNVLRILQIEDFSTEKLVELDKKALKIYFSLDSFIRHIHIDMQQ